MYSCTTYNDQVKDCVPRQPSHVQQEFRATLCVSNFEKAMTDASNGSKAAVAPVVSDVKTVSSKDEKTVHLLPWFFNKVESDGLIDDKDFKSFCHEHRLDDSIERSERAVKLDKDALVVLLQSDIDLQTADDVDTHAFESKSDDTRRHLGRLFVDQVHLCRSDVSLVRF
jgi:hypothetical protein